MLFCFRYKKLLMPYAEGELDADLRTRVEMHVSRCPSCAAELAELRSVSSALRVADVPAAEPAPDLWMRVQQAITEPVPVQRPWWQLKSYQVASAAAVAGVFLVAVLSVQLPKNAQLPGSTTRSQVRTEDQQKRQAKAPQPVLPDSTQKPADIISKMASTKAYPVRRPASAPSPLLAEKTSTEGSRTIVGLRPTPPPLPDETMAKVETVDESGGYSDAESKGLKLKADNSDKSRTVKSPFSQMGRAPGGSQNYGMIEESQSGVLGDKDAFYRLERTEPAASLAPPPAAPAPAPSSLAKSSLAFSGAATGGLSQKEKPLVVADAPGSVLGSMCNISAPLTRSGKDTDTASVGDYRTTTTDTMKRIGDVESRIKKNPRDAGAWLELAETYEQAGQTEKAKDAYRKAIEFGDKAIKITAEAKLEKLEGRKK